MKDTGKPLPEPSAAERAFEEVLEADVRALAEGIGARDLATGGLERAARWIGGRMEAVGYRPERHRYKVTGPAVWRGDAENLVAEVPGAESPREIVVVGAHYDSVVGSPGANDNASGVAALLALAEWFRVRPQPRSIRFAAFANEEPPCFMTPAQGSHAYVAACRDADEKLVAMFALDGIGFFSNEPGSQQFPVAGADLVYPDRGNFIGFVTRLKDAGLLRRAIGAFRKRASVPSEGVALPASVPGVAWSDHWSFWEHGYPAFFLTDTLPFRDPCYHTPGDTADRLDYARMARVTEGLKAVVEELACLS